MKTRMMKTRMIRYMERPTAESVISRILNNNAPPSNAELGYLSELEDEELDLFNEAWSEISQGRRRELVSNLVRLSETNFRLDFTRIFSLCLEDDDPEIRIQAINGLAEDENQHHVALLAEIMESDSSEDVRATAVTALGRFAMLAELGELAGRNTSRVYKTLLDIVDSEAESAELKSLALEAISPLNMPRINELIEKYYRSEDNILKTSAIRAMGRNCDPCWLDVLANEIHNSDAGIRYEVARTCGEIAIDEAIPHLRKLLRDENLWIREAVVYALESIGSENARQELDKLTRNPEPKIRESARQAIKELDWDKDILFTEY
jgi:HEAT repeat protein